MFPLSRFDLEAGFAILVALICFVLLLLKRNGSVTSILSLLIGRFLGQSEAKKRNRKR